MEKIKLIIEITVEEMNELTKTFVDAKKTKLIPSYYTFDEFLHELLVSFSKMPKLDGANTTEMMETLAKIKDSFGESGIGNIFEDMFSGKNKKFTSETKEKQKKESKPEEEEYKS